MASSLQGLLPAHSATPALLAPSPMPSTTRSTPARLNLIPHRALKRRRSDSPLAASNASRATAPIALMTTDHESASKRARDQFFDALGSGDGNAGLAKKIASADDLDRAELRKCFEILHACGKATDPTASLTSTRESIDSFLGAIFKDWSSESQDELLKPELELFVEVENVAGRICVDSEKHQDITACIASDLCTVNVSAVATFSTVPPMLKMELSMIDPFTNQPDTITALGRDDIRWVTGTDWLADLRATLQCRVVSKLHKHNKHLAVWQARKLVQGWAKGDVSMGLRVGGMGFLGTEVAKSALLGFGSSA